jgi:hypothetical protein
MAGGTSVRLKIDRLRSSLALLAIIALIALFATRRIPAQQPTASPESEPTALTGEPGPAWCGWTR